MNLYRAKFPVVLGWECGETYTFPQDALVTVISFKAYLLIPVVDVSYKDVIKTLRIKEFNFAFEDVKQ